MQLGDGTLSARAINAIIGSTSPTSGQSTLKNGIQQRVQLTSLAVRKNLHSLPNISLALDILAVREMPVCI